MRVPRARLRPLGERGLSGDAQEGGAGNAHLFARPTPSWIPPNYVRRRGGRVCAHGVPEVTSGDKCVRSGKVRVSPFGGNHPPRPCGPASGSLAKGESGLLLLLCPRHIHGFSADLFTEGLHPSEGTRTGVVGNGWTVGPSTFGRKSMCVKLRLVGEIAVLSYAIVAYVCPVSRYSSESFYESAVCAWYFPNPYSQTVSPGTTGGKPAGGYKPCRCQTDFPLALALALTLVIRAGHYEFARKRVSAIPSSACDSAKTGPSFSSYSHVSKRSAPGRAVPLRVA